MGTIVEVDRETGRATAIRRLSVTEQEADRLSRTAVTARRPAT
jgi:hypothetical protein